jgi:hypothetical protein
MPAGPLFVSAATPGSGGIGRDIPLHPVIRIVCFLVIAAALSLGARWQSIALGALLMLVAYGVSSQRGLGHLGRMVSRLRWLWLSLAVVYLWFTPGPDLVPALGAWSPTLAGLQQAGVRVGVLMILVAGANLLLQATAREQLVAAIHWLTAPLDRVGLSSDRFALRLVLVLETVPKIQPLRRLSAGEAGEQAPSGRVARIALAVSGVLRSTLAQARSAPPREIAVPDSGAPPLRQWLLPALLAFGFWLVGFL